MIKKLTRLGNSSALVVDKALMELLEIDADTPLKVSVRDKRMIVEPLSPRQRNARFQSAMKKAGRKNAELFRRLAK